MPGELLRKPEWIKVPLSGAGEYAEVRRTLSELRLTTVCEGARCPNLGECWGRGTATLMILGDACTRDCRFCDVKHGAPPAPNPTEPERAAEAVARLGLKYVVITSVTRDDLPDGGAAHWAEVIAAVREKNPETVIEVLIPDLKGDAEALAVVFEARPDVLGHNLEAVPRLYASARPSADYERSLAVLKSSAEFGLVTKTGIMAGLGETNEEIEAVFRDVRERGAAIITVGQYLQPSRGRLPVEKYVTPDEFDAMEKRALSLGFTAAVCGPLVRSSYLADQAFAKARKNQEQQGRAS